MLDVIVFSSRLQIFCQKDCPFFPSFLQEIKIEMTGHQLSVDFVNQSLLQTSSPDHQATRYQVIHFAEQLGAINHRWLLLQGALESKVRSWLM